MLYIASDHGGFKLKEDLKKFLKREEVAFEDVGPKKPSPNDDYPDIAKIVSEKVSNHPPALPGGAKRSTVNLGLLICRSGQGVCIVANKFKNVRAGLVWNPAEARASRNDDMTNVLCLPADYVSSETATVIVKNCLITPFSKEERHVRRVKKIQELEKTLLV